MAKLSGSDFIKQLKEENSFLISQNKELRYLLIYMDRFADKLGISFNGHPDFVNGFLRKVANIMSITPAYVDIEKAALTAKLQRDAELRKRREEKRKKRKAARQQRKALTTA